MRTTVKSTGSIDVMRTILESDSVPFHSLCHFVEEAGSPFDMSMVSSLRYPRELRVVENRREFEVANTLSGSVLGIFPNASRLLCT